MIGPTTGLKRLIVSLSVAMAVGSPAAFAADVFIGTPPFNPPAGQQVTIDLLVDVGGDVLGSYFFDFQYDPAVVHIVSIGGGTTSEFSGAPATDPVSFATGTTPLASAQGSISAPVGFVSVATVTLTAVGLPADASDLDLPVSTLFDAQAQTLSSTVFPSSVLIALPEVPPNLVFNDGITLAWAPAPDVTHYDVYRGTLPTSGTALTFNHTCLAPDLVATSTTDTSTPAAGQGFYYLIAAERNQVEGPLGVTSQGLVRPNFFSCSSAALASASGSEIRALLSDDSPSIESSFWSVRLVRNPSNADSSSVDPNRVAPDAFALWTTGDANADGRLDDTDADTILKAVVGAQRLSLPGELEADVDGSGNVDVADAQRIRQFLTLGRGSKITRLQGGLPIVLGSADCSLVDFEAGQSLVRLRCLPEGYTAFELLRDLADDSAAVQRFDPVEGRYLTARIVVGQPAGDDFQIRRVEGFLLDLNQAQRGFRPRRNVADGEQP